MHEFSGACSAAGTLGVLCEWLFVSCDTFLLCSTERYPQGCFNPERPLFFLTKTPLFPRSHQPPYLITPLQQCNCVSSKEPKMSRYRIRDNNNCFNNTNFNVQNNYVVADDRSPLLTWLSPLEPKLRHRDIQERRVDNVGEWFLQTGEFRSWHEWSGEGEGDKAVLFCYGGPGVGKTFIR